MSKQKTNLTLIILLIILLISACKKQDKPYPATLLEVERLSDNEAEKALPLLEQLKDSLNLLDEEGYMYYNLLSLKVSDKLYIRHTSDSTIKRITAFYETYGERDKLLEAYYYMGRVYSDLGDAPEALHYFQKALDIAGDTKRYLLLSKIYNQMGTLYDYQGVYELAIPVLKKAYQNILLSKDCLTVALPIRDIARIYNATEKKDSAVFFYEEAYKLALATGNTKRASGILIELSSVYRESGRCEDAMKCIQISMQDTSDRDLNTTYSALGGIYYKMSQLDSAYYYYQKCLNSDNIQTLAYVSNKLYKIEMDRQNNKNAIKYIHLYLQYHDSIKKITTSEEVRKMSSLYNYQLKEKENQRLTLENAKGKASTQQLLFICISLFFIAIFLINRLKRKRKEAEEQTLKIQKEKETQYRESKAQIEDNNKKLSDLEILLSEKEKKNVFSNTI